MHLYLSTKLQTNRKIYFVFVWGFYIQMTCISLQSWQLWSGKCAHMPVNHCTYYFCINKNQDPIYCHPQENEQFFDCDRVWDLHFPLQLSFCAASSSCHCSHTFNSSIRTKPLLLAVDNTISCGCTLEEMRMALSMHFTAIHTKIPNTVRHSIQTNNVAGNYEKK